MSRGRPDYWYGMTPNKSIYGIGQTSWHIGERAEVPGDSFVDVCEYTVPAEYILHIGVSGCSCNGPGIQKVCLLLMGCTLGTIYYEGYISSMFPDSCVYQFPAGTMLACRLYNLDNVPWIIGATIMGFLEMRGG